MPRLIMPCLTILLVLVAAGMRLVDLEADPPPDMHIHFVSDEGWWARNARNHAVFGRWAMDDFNPGLYAAPVWTGMLRGAYAVLGVGVWQTRMVPAAAGVLTLLCIGGILVRHAGPRAALFGMGIWAFDYFVVSNNRVAFVEPVPTLFMVLAVLLYGSRSASFTAGLLAGMVAVVGVFAKINTLFFLPALPLATLIGIWAHRGGGGAPQRHQLRTLAGYVMGAAACGAIWWLAFVTPNRPEFAAQMAIHASENNPGFGLHLLSRPWSFGLRETENRLVYGGLLAQSLLTLIPACLWLIHLAAGIQRRGLRAQLRQINRAEIIALCWFVCMVLPLIPARHGWDRRYYNLTVPLTILGACAIGARRSSRERETEIEPAPATGIASSLGRSGAAAVLVVVPFLLYLRVPIANALIPLTDKIAIGSEPGLTPGACCGLAGAIILGVCLPIAWWLLRRIRFTRFPAVPLTAAVCLLAVVLQGSRYQRTVASWSHSISAASDRLATILPANARVAGGLADSLLFASSAQTLPLLDRSQRGPGVVNRALVAHIRPTHCLLDGHVPDDRLAREVEAYLGPAARLASDPVERVGLWDSPGGEPRLYVTLCRVVISEPGLEPLADSFAENDRVPLPAEQNHR